MSCRDTDHEINTRVASGGQIRSISNLEVFGIDNRGPRK